MITLWTWVAIGIGGGLGTMTQFAVTRQMSSMSGNYLPYETLTVNTVGSWLLGFLAVALVDRSEISAARFEIRDNGRFPGGLSRLFQLLVMKA